MKTINGVDVLTTIEELVHPLRSAVLVIDMQNRSIRHDVPYVAEIIPNLQRLLAAARSRGVPVVYAEIIHRNRLGAPLVNGPAWYWARDRSSVPDDLVEGTWEAQTVDELAPQGGDFIIHKSRASAMYHTALDDFLSLHRVESLIITGCVTGGSVLMTAVNACSHGYYPVVIRDCVSPSSAKQPNPELAWLESQFPAFDAEEVMSTWRAMQPECARS